MHGTTEMIKSPAKSQMERVTITPQLATELLENNKNNRPIRDQHVKRIANQIRLGKWRFNGDTIKIASTKNVLDGQHRLWACIEAKKDIETIIVRDIDEDAFATIDTIRSIRSGSDVLALAGVNRHGRYVAEGLKWMLRYQRGTMEAWKAPGNTIENSDIEDAFSKHPGFVKAAERAAALRGVANPSIMSFVFYILSNRNWELGERLYDTMRNPVKVKVNDPFFQLRRYFLNDDKKKDPVVTIALCFKAINAAHKNKDVAVLNWKNQGSKVEAFPKIEA